MLPSIRKTGGYTRADASVGRLPAVDAAIKAIGGRSESRQFRLDTPDAYTDAERHRILRIQAKFA
ncbi:MAG: hypothetical protein LBK41_02755 [Clostridiales bacterium]|nr:hypothetical protein [Clostridiales bacterium]